MESTDKFGVNQAFSYINPHRKAQHNRRPRFLGAKRIMGIELNIPESDTMHNHKDQTRFGRLILAAQRVVKRGKTVKGELVSEELIRDRRRECAQESLEDLLKGVTPDNIHPLIEPGPDVGKEIISDE